MSAAPWPARAAGRGVGHRRGRRVVVVAGLLVGLLAVGSVSSLTAQAEKGSSSGGSSSGSSNSGSGKGSGGGGSDDGVPESPSTSVKGDDNPSPSIPGVSSSVPASAPSTVFATVPPSVPSTVKGGASATALPTTAAVSSGSGGSRRFDRTTACGSLTLAVEVRAEKSTLRVRTTIDKTSATWNAVILQERRVTWRGTARKGRIDRTLTDLPGPELLSVRLTSATGAVCVADLQLPG